MMSYTVNKMNYFQILGISSIAKDEEIRAAYKKLAMRYHPDRPGGDKEKFDQVTRAFRALYKRTCPDCEGRGQVRIRDGAFTKLVNCPRCWGKEIVDGHAR